MRQVNENIEKEFPKGLLAWYSFEKGAKALFVSGIKECEVLAEYMRAQNVLVDEKEIEELVLCNAENNAGYDYIVTAGGIETCSEPVRLLEVLRRLLSRKGKLLIGADNRLGIRYFCGDRDRFTGRNFDSIENYVRAGERAGGIGEGRAYSRAEWSRMLELAGFCHYKFYSTVPSFTHPQIMISEDYLPQEELETRIHPEYNYPNSVFLEEQKLYDGLIQNGLFHIMADGFLIECAADGLLSDVRQITNSLERGKNNAFITIVRENEVEKRAVYEEGIERLNVLLSNSADLKSRGIHVLESEMKGNSLVMPYIKAENATAYFRRLLAEDQEMFLQELDRFWQLILQSSEHVPYEEVDWERFEPDWESRKKDCPDKDKWRKVAFGEEEDRKNLGVILKRGYLDLASINCFVADGGFVFFDQEFVVDNLPAAALMIRTICFIYQQGRVLEEKLPMRLVLERYHAYKYFELFIKFEQVYLGSILNHRELMLYYKSKRSDRAMIHSNRQRMNYSENEYQRLFRNIFEGTDGKKIYLFGSGKFARLFLSRFGNDYDIAGIFDNNSARHGEQLDGIEILPPDRILALKKGSYKIIICIKNYTAVIRQLCHLQVSDYGVFDVNMDYPRKKIILPSQPQEKAAPKRYHTGYVAGVFDVFHIGHLNLLRRAKEQCDYLIVGVVSDESVIKNKKTAPYIPFDERIEIVRACRYVDEAVRIPEDYGSTEEAYLRYRFDAQFSGSDYENDPAWLAEKMFLEQHGADLVFFPYTEKTSSTKIKEQLRGRIVD